MLRTRVIPAMLLRNGALVKTRRFGRFEYIGDPCNTLRIFNELEVDELVVLDIMATRAGREPDYRLLEDIASECFMPLAYGGGIGSREQAKRIFDIGFEKVILNSHAHRRPELVDEIAERYGRQAVVASIDVKRSLFGSEQVWTRAGTRKTGRDPVEWAKELARRGAGEILLTSIEQEGTWEGFDIELIRRVSQAVDVPVVAQGGASGVDDVVAAVRDGGASSVAVGAMVVYQKKDFGVLVNFPEQETLKTAFTGIALNSPSGERVEAVE